MKFVKEGVLLTPEEYHKYQRMEACINELQSMKTDFIQTPHEEVEPWSLVALNQPSNLIMTSKNTSTTTASTKQQMKMFFV